jgi:hypothetical protein
MIECIVHFLRGMWAFPRRAITTVGDRSFLTEILALFLAAGLAWPGTGCTRSGQAAISSLVPVVASSVGHPLLRARSQGFKPAPERHMSKLRGVLDDDPAMLSDESEDWVEDFSGLVADYPADHAHGSFYLAVPVVGMNAGFPPTPTSQIHVLCRYQC